jgi:arylsulfatase A-like enzyme
MLTGLYPSQHGGGVVEDRLPGTTPTLARLLEERGYLTAGFSGGELCASHWGVGNGFSLYRDPDGFETRGDGLTDAVLGLMERQRNKALFLFVNYFDPHAPYVAPLEIQRRLGVPELRDRIAALPLWGKLASGDDSAWSDIIKGKAPATPDVLAWLRAAYLAEVAFMDQQVGRLLEALKRDGLYDRALVLLVGDHGEFLGEDGFFSHACRLDSALIEVPLIVKWPHQRAGQRVADLASVADIMPTVLVAVGAGPTPAGGAACNLADRAGLAARQRLLMEEHETWFHPLFDNMRVATHLYGWQSSTSRDLFWQGGNRCERKGDAGWEPTACETSWEERLRELSERVRARQPAPDQGPGALTEEDRAKLKALGYL